MIAVLQAALLLQQPIENRKSKKEFKEELKEKPTGNSFDGFKAVAGNWQVNRKL